MIGLSVQSKRVKARLAGTEKPKRLMLLCTRVKVGKYLIECFSNPPLGFKIIITL